MNAIDPMNASLHGLGVYQIEAWRGAWVEHFGEGPASQCILPAADEWFCKTTVAELKIARFVGGKMNNFNVLTGMNLPSGVDLIHLEKLPRPEALALRATPRLLLVHPDPFWRAAMGDDFLAWERLRRSGKSRSRLRGKLQALERSSGSADVCEAETPEDVMEMLKAFHEQRIRTAAQGRIPNPFGCPRHRAFILKAAMDSVAGNDGFRLFALTAGDRIVAVNAALFSRTYMSGFATSMDEDYSAFSPGKILQREVLRIAHDRGVRKFDLGLGDDAYKAEWTDRTNLYDVLVPVSRKGYLAAAAIAAKLVVTYLLKRTAVGKKLAKSVRLRLAS